MAKGRVILERRFVPEGSIIIHEGDEAYSAYLIQSGSVIVYSVKNGRKITLAELGVGEICGEMALIDGNMRTANVRAAQDCNLIVITRAAFEDKLGSSDTTIQAVVKMLIGRIKSGNSNVLSQEHGVEALINSVNVMSEDILKDMNEGDARKFKGKVTPKLNAFIKALEDF